MELLYRPRRNRRTSAIRALSRETHLAVQNLVYPVFIHEGDDDQAIDSLPGCTRWSISGLINEAKYVYSLGVPAIVLFPAISEELKTQQCEEAYNLDGLIPRAIRQLKAEIPGLVVITDVALDPYNSLGHDGLVEKSDLGEIKILNDPTVEVLCKQALCHAKAGADIVAPSDMMDGRIEAIRHTLDENGFEEVGIMAYSAKYASAFYGPFRGALESAPKQGNKKTYQMDPANRREAVREAMLDESEGADYLMVKPATAYLDVIAQLHETSSLPIAAYHVSGEYLMLKAASASGWLEEKDAVLETLVGIRRAGAQIILTYYARQVAEWLSEKNEIC